MKPLKITALSLAVLAAILLSASLVYAALPAVTGFAASSTSPTAVNLSWTASPDPATAGYKIFQNGAQIATVTPISAISYPVGGLTPSTSYIFGISAYNSAEASALATTSITTLPDTAAPSVPAITSATPVSPNQINLLWASSTDNVAVTGYKVYRDDSQIATTSGLSLADTSLLASTTHRYNVSAFDAAGNVSATSSTVSATTLATGTPDTVPPSKPTNLAATPVSSSRIDLTWTASTDNVGVTGYKVFRNDSLVNTTLAANYSDIGLAASTTYAYNIVAIDAAGNFSSSSDTVSATTLGSGAVATTTARIKVIGGENNGRVINLRSNAKIKVIVYGGTSFNVRNIDPKSVTFAGAPAVNNWRAWHNRDRHLDRVFEFRARDMKDLLSLGTTTTQAEVSFKATVKGVPIELKTTVRVKNIKRWHDDRDREHEKAVNDSLKKEMERIREAAKKAMEHEREAAKDAQEKLREQLKDAQEKLRESTKDIKTEMKNVKEQTKSKIKGLKQEVKSNKSEKGNRGKSDD
jgi:chitodextrinase